ECLLVSLTEAGQSTGIKKGAILDGRLFQGDDILNFSSGIVHVSKRPHQIVSIQIPQSFTQTDMRVWPRVPTLEYLNLAVKNETTGALKLYKGKMSNISLSGAGLDIPASMGKPGDRISIRFRLGSDGEEYDISMNAVIRQIRPRSHNKLALRKSWFFHGVEFDLPHMKGEDKLNLQGFIYEQSKTLRH
ncbi:MAG: PilZ domain-containing protein, partial [Gammaproteobacteria bacterium]|nr:PilZ domain-containing protein [Gammaproteobacteria bacterium]